ncbi:hypothetical protein ZIOFF_038374 [Zingiber officinale]|uniref:Dof zinc finger protein n=1 Tax=Zingiber officinale TaxID=94328 RepID=A0A8J5KSK3_ZINOF|nr:hypothetical protein ZIOFF_038374 [Zingiber officinale]
MQGSPAPAPYPAAKPPFSEQEQNLRCPRCDSTDTKFCYYNNYNLSQPRHFCKSCRRYWTKGGALRNVPVGGGTRKSSKRSGFSSSSSAASNPKRSNPPKSSSELCGVPKAELVSTIYPPLDPDRHLLDMPGSFSSLLASEGAFDGFLGSLSPLGPAVLPISSDAISSSIEFHGIELPNLFSGNTNNDDAETPAAEVFDRLDGDSGCWASGWTDLAINNPGKKKAVCEICVARQLTCQQLFIVCPLTSKHDPHSISPFRKQQSCGGLPTGHHEAAPYLAVPGPTS